MVSSTIPLAVKPAARLSCMGLVSAAPRIRARAAIRPMAAHQPVLLDACLHGLRLREDGTYLDGTFGRGGHSAAMLDRLGASGVLHALDQDPQAEQAAQAFVGRPGFYFHRANFSQLGTLCAGLGVLGRVDGVLLDLGVSSPQFDDAERGFSFTRDGPLDMRMDPTQGEPVSAWLNRSSADEIADVLFEYGEERASRRIARRIVEARQAARIERTGALAELIQRALPGPRQRIHPATRSFQALRIFINRELDVLPLALHAAVEVLRPGGRLAVISFHSLEDRLVKRFMRDQPEFKAIERVFPDDAEIASNPRSRSAVLRVAERLP